MTITASAETVAKIEARAVGRKLRPDEKAKLCGPPILLAHAWSADVDPTGYWMSEKLDGVRAYWNGTQFISRQGNVYPAPAWFTEGLPDHPLDGELWMARGAFQKTISIVKRQDAGMEWEQLGYCIYDAPQTHTPFEERMQFLNDEVEPKLSGFASILSQQRCENLAALKSYLAEVLACGGEGVMLRQPNSLYEAKRSHTLLKVKQFHDAEAVVIGHTPGKGRHKGRMGALEVRMPDGKEFLIGTGFSDAQRESPPSVGTTVTYSFTELTVGGVPKCAAFLRVRPNE